MQMVLTLKIYALYILNNVSIYRFGSGVEGIG